MVLRMEQSEQRLRENGVTDPGWSDDEYPRHKEGERRKAEQKKRDAPRALSSFIVIPGQ
jgi:hypothetical protein